MDPVKYSYTVLCSLIMYTVPPVARLTAPWKSLTTTVLYYYIPQSVEITLYNDLMIAILIATNLPVPDSKHIPHTRGCVLTCLRNDQ